MNSTIFLIRYGLDVVGGVGGETNRGDSSKRTEKLYFHCDPNIEKEIKSN